MRQLLNFSQQDPDAIISRLPLIERFGLEHSIVGREKGEGSGEKIDQYACW